MIKNLTQTLVFGIFLYGSQAGAGTLEEEFDVRPGGTLTVISDRGQITVETSRRSEVVMEVDIEGPDADNMRIETQKNGNNVIIRGRYRGDNGWRSVKVRYRFLVPTEFNVDLKTGGGSINISDLKGEIDVQTSGGSMTFGNIDGPVRGRTSGGSVTLEGSRGPARLRTSGGSINVGDVVGNLILFTSGGSINIGEVEGDVDAKTSGGAIHIEQAHGAIDAHTSGGSITAYISKQPESDSQLRTSAGTVTVYLANGIGVDLNAQTSMGSVKTDFPVDGVTKAKRRLSGPINGGGPELFLSTSVGSVRVKSR